MRNRNLLNLALALLMLGINAVHSQPVDYVSLWQGEDNALDATGTNNGTLIGDATFAAGKVGQAFSLDGSGDMVRMADSPRLDITGSMTISAWFKTDVNEKSGMILTKLDNWAAYSSYQLVLLGRDNECGSAANKAGCNGAVIAIFRNANGSQAVAGSWRNNGLPGTPPLNDGEWHHVVARFDAGIDGGTGRASLYVDGAFVHESSQTIHAMSTNNLPVTIGGRKNPGSPSWNGGTRSRYFRGLIDEVAIYDRAVSDNEIEQLAGGGPIPLTIDVKPGSYRNPINLKSRGVIPVAILTTDDFDASQVDGASVRFAGVSAEHGGHVEDVDGDGDIDWLGHFNTQDAAPVLAMAATSASLDIVDASGSIVAQGSDAIDIGVGKSGKSKKAGKVVATGTQAATWGEIKSSTR
jgi:hypothetical protein